MGSNEKNRRGLGIRIALGMLLVAGAIVYYFWVFLVGGFPFPVTSVWRYKQVLAFVRHSAYPYPQTVDVLRFFPPSIPSEASNVRVFMNTPPGDMQFELRCTLSGAEMTQLLDRAVPVAIATGHGTDDTFGWDQKVVPLPFPQLETIDPARSKLPASYEIYVTDTARAKLGATNTSVYVAGIAVDRSTRDVIYWLEQSAE